MGSNADSVHSHAHSPSDQGSSASSSGYPYRLDMDFQISSSNGSMPSMSSTGHGMGHSNVNAIYPSSHVSSPQSAGAGSGSNAVFLPQAPFDISRHQQHAPPTLRNVTFPPQASGPYAHSTSFHRSSGAAQHASPPHSQSSALFIDLLSSTNGSHHGHAHGHPAHAQAQTSASSHFSPFDWPVHGHQQQTPQQHENGGSP